MVGLVSLDHNHASRLAVEMMSKLGYSVSYDEVFVLSMCISQCGDDEDTRASRFPRVFHTVVC